MLQYVLIVETEMCFKLRSLLPRHITQHGIHAGCIHNLIRVENISMKELTIKELDIVDLLVYRRTDIGYVVIINNQHTGVLHHNEIYRDITSGDTFKGFIKKIYPEDKAGKDRFRIDVAAGKPGYNRVEDETQKILRLLQENNGYLPYYDKSDPEEIYSFFGMSKKTFKMTVGNLYKQKKISLEKTGIRLV